MKKVAEICCGSIEDALIAQRAGADRIELNNAMYLFGLTPSLGTIKLAVESCHVPLVVMARPRPGGFNYNDYELDTILADIESMVEYDIEGVAFGCLDENGNIDKEKNKKIILFTRGINCRLASLFRCHLISCPSRYGEFRVLGMVTACLILQYSGWVITIS